MEAETNLGISSVSSVQHIANTAILCMWSEMLLNDYGSVAIRERANVRGPFGVWDLLGVSVFSSDKRLPTPYDPPSPCVFESTGNGR